MPPSTPPTPPGPAPAGSVVASLPRMQFVTWAVLLIIGPLVEFGSFFAVPRGTERLVYLNAGQTVASIFAWLVLRLVARGVAHAYPATKASGRLLAAGALCWALGNAVFMAQEISLGFAPFPSWYDLFFIAAYVAFGASLLRLPQTNVTRTARTDHRLELAALVLVTGLAAWEFKLHSSLAALVKDPSLVTGYPLLYPLLDIGLLWVLFQRVLNQDNRRLPLVPVFLLIIALFALVAADFSLPNLIFIAVPAGPGATSQSVWSVLTEKLVVTTENQGGSSWTSLGWGFFSALLGLAGLAQLRAMAAAPSGPSAPKVVPRAVVILLVTYLWIAIMLLLLLRGLFVPGAIHSPWLVSGGVMLLLTLVIARQLREVLNNESLNRRVEELAASREHFRRLFQLFPDAVVLGSMETGTMVEVNEGFSRIFGYGYDECVGRSTLDLNLWESPEKRAEFVAELRRARIIVQREWTARRRDGELFPVEMNARIVEIAGQEFLLNLVRDLTDRKQAEERLRRSEDQLRQAQKLEAIGTLAGGIAHDFNNLLTGVIGNAEIALLDLERGHPAYERVKGLLDAGNTGKAMVRQILTFARRHEHASHVVDLRLLLAEVIRLLQPAAGGTEIRFQLRGPAARALGDATQLHQVFLNLGTNALHALRDRPDGLLEFIVEPFLPDEPFAAAHAPLAATAYVHVIVRDSGCGMGKEVLARIFEPFFTTRPHGAGTGLGLAVVHGIVEAHGGVITVYSSPGNGSAFHVYLPAASGEVVRPIAEPVAQGRGQSVMYVDDDAQAASATERLLAKLGYQPSAFTRPEDAIEYYRTHAPQVGLVVSDFAMPGMDGIVFFQKLRGVRSDVTFVLASGYISETDTARARAAGIDCFLEKPFSLAELARVVQTGLGE